MAEDKVTRQTLNFKLSPLEEQGVLDYAASNLSAAAIAAAMEWPLDMQVEFSLMAQIPGSNVARLIAAGRAKGVANVHLKLYELARKGDLEAAKELARSQAVNRVNDLINNMDEDEFAG